MRERLFSVTGAVRYSGPRRVKRTWGRTVVCVLALLGLVALAWWLLGCVHGATVPAMRTGLHLRAGGVPLAVAPVMQGMVFGALLSFSLVGIVLAVRKMARDEDEAKLQWSAAGAARGRAAEPRSETPAPCPDPLALPYVGMKQEDLLRILASLIVESCMGEELVRKALSPDAARPAGPIYCPHCGVLAGTHPKTDTRLIEAMRCLQRVVLCLGQLADCAAKSGMNNEPEQKGNQHE